MVRAALRLNGLGLYFGLLFLLSLLCQAVADRSGRQVFAGPVEATALGNVLVQARTAGALAGDLETLRRLVADTQHLTRFTPRAARERTRA